MKFWLDLFSEQHSGGWATMTKGLKRWLTSGTEAKEVRLRDRFEGTNWCSVFNVVRGCIPLFKKLDKVVKSGKQKNKNHFIEKSFWNLCSKKKDRINFCSETRFASNQFSLQQDLEKILGGPFSRLRNWGRLAVWLKILNKKAPKITKMAQMRHLGI